MPVYRIPSQHVFPDPTSAQPDGLLGVGGDLHPRRLMLAYNNGIFPWYNEGQPILWFSPDPRFVIFPDALVINRSLRKVVRKRKFEIRLDTQFAAVVQACRQMSRPRQKGSWITEEMAEAYTKLHEEGHAHSVEAFLDGELVGGLYGVGVGTLFSGESMFAHVSDASKVAFVWLVEQLKRWGYRLIDCQVPTDHLGRFGAVEISRQRYLEQLSICRTAQGREGTWTFDSDFSGASVIE